MTYPSIKNYRASLLKADQFTFSSLSNKQFRVVLNDKNEPITETGNSSIVFKITDGELYYALKCFVTDVTGRWEYLETVKDKLSHSLNDRVISFDILTDALTISNDKDQRLSCSVLLMPWVEGERLSHYVSLYSRQSNQKAIRNLYHSLKELVAIHLKNSFSHGDISPENIIVSSSGKMTLVDYDSVTFSEWDTPLLGRGDWSFPYQHPQRHPLQNTMHADEFSFLILATTLKALEYNTGLYQQFNSSRGLLFSIVDLKLPFDSPLIQAMEKINEPHFQLLLNVMLIGLHKNTAAVPGLLQYLDGNTSPEDEVLFKETVKELKTKAQNLYFTEQKETAAEILKIVKEKKTEEALPVNFHVNTKEYKKKRKKIRTGVIAILSAVMLFLFGIKYFYPDTIIVHPEEYQTPSNVNILPIQENSPSQKNSFVSAKNKTSDSVSQNDAIFLTDSIDNGSAVKNRPIVPSRTEIRPNVAVNKKAKPKRKKSYQNKNYDNSSVTFRKTDF